ncbi:MAG: DUF1573 domain-containing protein [Planctomycetota bacterium]
MTLPRAALWAALALGASAGAPLLGTPLDGDEGTALVFTPLVFDFGTVRAGAPARAEFAFVNESLAPVRILSVHGTCGCVTATASTSYVEPRGRGTIKATLSTEGRQGRQTLRVRVRTDEGARGGTRLTLAGEIRVALRPQPPRILLGAVAPGSEHVAEIRVEKLEPLPDVNVTCSGDGLSAEKLAEDAASLTLRVTVKVPWTRAGQQRGVRLAGDTWIPVAWIVPPPFELSAKEIEIKGGKGELVAKPRWPGVALARVDTHGLKLSVARDGDRIVLSLEGSPFDIPSGATVDLVPEPLSLGVVAVPVYVGFE